MKLGVGFQIHDDVLNLSAGIEVRQADRPTTCSRARGPSS